MSTAAGAPSENKPSEIARRVSKKGWSKEEDAKLLKLVHREDSTGKWSKIACELGGIRTGKQCRERYQNHLRPDINKSEWSPEEDKIVIDLKEKLGTQWSKIALELPGRSDNAVKNRWHLINRYSLSAKSIRKAPIVLKSKGMRAKEIAMSTSLNAQMLEACQSTACPRLKEESSATAKPLLPSREIESRPYSTIACPGAFGVETDAQNHSDPIDLNLLYYAHCEHCHGEKELSPYSGNLAALTVSSSISDPSDAALTCKQNFVENVRILQSPAPKTSDRKRSTAQARNCIPFSPARKVPTLIRSSKKQSDPIGSKNTATSTAISAARKGRSGMGRTKEERLMTMMSPRLSASSGEHQWIDDFLTADTSNSKSSAESPFSENLRSISMSMSLSMSMTQDETQGVYPSPFLLSGKGKGADRGTGTAKVMGTISSRFSGMQLPTTSIVEKSVDSDGFMLLDIGEDMEDNYNSLHSLSMMYQSRSDHRGGLPSFSFSPTPLSIGKIDHPLHPPPSFHDFLTTATPKRFPALSPVPCGPHSGPGFAPRGNASHLQQSSEAGEKENAKDLNIVVRTDPIKSLKAMF